MSEVKTGFMHKCGKLACTQQSIELLTRLVRCRSSCSVQQVVVEHIHVSPSFICVYALVAIDKVIKQSR